MAEEDKNIGTALAVVEAQQNIIGNAMIGATDSAMIVEPVERTTELLERLTQINMLMLKNLNEIFGTLRETLGLDKLQDRRAKEDQTELEKENLSGDVGGVGGNINSQEADNPSGGMFGFLGLIPSTGIFKKMFAPIVAFLGKGGLLVKLFGRFGPLGALILGFTLLYKYSDEISKALAPALEKIKDLFVKLKPAIDVLKQIGDFLMQGIIKGIGEAITFLIGTVEKFIDGITKIFEGDIMGGLNDIFEGIIRTILTVPLTIINFLKPLFLDIIDYISEPWNNMVTNVNQYISDTFIAISNYFIELKDKFVGFFVEAYNTVKQTITDTINGAFTFIGNIFTTIGNLFSDSFNMVKDFVTGLPGRIVGFVKNMFSPIIDFFLNIGNTIKKAVNGVIESLPLPDFVKRKIKFNIAPSEAELKEAESLTGDAKVAEKIASDQREGIEKIGGDNVFKDGVLQQNGKNLEVFSLGFAESIAEEMGDQVKVAMNKKTGKYVIVKNDMKLAEREGTTVQSQDLDMTDIIGQGGIDTNIKIPSTSIPDLANDNQGAVTVVNNNYNTNNSSVANQTDVHSGALDTGIDSYHDKLATASS
jgi:hypothetical protein